MRDGLPPIHPCLTAPWPTRIADGTGRRADGAGWGLPGSLLLHAPLIAAIALVPVAAPMRPAPVVGIVVELVSAAPGAPVAGERTAEAPAAPAPSVAAVAPAPPIPSPPEAPPPRADPARDDEMVRPAAMLAAAVLADPPNSEARAALAGMDGSERLIQLCNVEAMSQIHHWRDELEPDQVVAYASADVAVAGTTVSATGAAFRSRHRWYGLRFRCETAADGAAVTAFEFRVGDAIPKTRWEDLSLPDDGGGAAPDD